MRISAESNVQYIPVNEPGWRVGRNFWDDLHHEEYGADLTFDLFPLVGWEIGAAGPEPIFWENKFADMQRVVSAVTDDNLLFLVRGPGQPDPTIEDFWQAFVDWPIKSPDVVLRCRKILTQQLQQDLDSLSAKWDVN